MNAKLVSFAALIVLACGPNFQQPPPCGGPHEVLASLSSVTLASDCASPEPRGVADSAAGACAEGYACASLCRQSSMQLSFTSLSPANAAVAILAVRLMDPTTHALLQTLTSRDPRQWKADQYVIWDEQVPAGVELKTTYKLSAPTFNYAADSDGRFGYRPYSVEVDVAIDGIVRTLQAEATREPEVAT